MNKKIFVYAVIVILMLVNTVDNFIDLAYLTPQTSLLILNSIIAVIFSVIMIGGLFLFSKLKVSGRYAKIVCQGISYLWVLICFEAWTIHVNFSLLSNRHLAIYGPFLSQLYTHMTYSLFYTAIVVLFMKSISIPISYKDIKK